MTLTTYKIAICLYTDVTNLDYGGPMELLGCLQPSVIQMGWLKSDYVMAPTYLHYDRTPFRGSLVGPMVTPDMAYDEVKEGEQFDILFVPGGT